MLTCILCPATFETQPIDANFPAGHTKLQPALDALAKQTAEGEAWEHVQLVTTRHGAKLELLAGGVCPAHKLEPGAVKIVVG